MGGRNILSFCFLKLHFDKGFICIPFFFLVVLGVEDLFLKEGRHGGPCFWWGSKDGKPSKGGKRGKQACQGSELIWKGLSVASHPIHLFINSIVYFSDDNLLNLYIASLHIWLLPFLPLS